MVAIPLSQAPTFTISWYQVGWSKDLGVGDVQSIQLCGRKLVLFRSQSGAPHVLSAHCPHLGADLGKGGKVCGEHLRCPFHGWEFDGKGLCSKIPYSDKIPPKAMTRSWHVVERHGLIFVRFDPEGMFPAEPPALTPELESGSWSKPVVHQYKMQAHHSDVLENAVDKAHFHSLHSIATREIQLTEQPDGSLYLFHNTTAHRFGFHFDTTIDLHFHNPGLQVIHIRKVLGTECRVLATISPIDDKWVIARLTTSIRPRFFKLWAALLSRLVAHFVSTTFAEDIPIWQDKVHHDHPVLTKGEHTIAQFRRWYAKYPVVAG